MLAARFFAPSLVDVSSVGGAAATKDLGWRKIVRLAIDSGSPAGRKGLEALYLLFNVFQPRAEITADPFETCRSSGVRCSASNQVILVPREVQPGEDAVFWLVFDDAASGGARTDQDRQRSKGVTTRAAPAAVL